MLTAGGDPQNQVWLVIMLKHLSSLGQHSYGHVPNTEVNTIEPVIAKHFKFQNKSGLAVVSF